MDYTNMATDALEARRQEIAYEATEDRSLEDLNALEAEMKAITAELETRKAAEAERRKLAESIATDTKIEPTNKVEPELRKESNMEIRNSKEYIDAYAEYIKTGKADECRALLTENATNGTVAVPEFVYDMVKTAWERDGLMSRVRKTFVKGNLKVNYEKSASGATKHTEGGAAVTEETLTLGTVNIIAANYKKWIGVSDEVMDTRGEEFLRYIFGELSQKIIEAEKSYILDRINTLSGATGDPKQGSYVASNRALSDFANALGTLSPEAGNSVIITSRTEWAAYEALRATAGYAYDPFLGMPVIFATMPEGVRALVGDPEYGIIANYPNGEDIKITFDEYTMATQDMNRVIGRQFVGIEVVAPAAFCVITSGGAN